MVSGATRRIPFDSAKKLVTQQLPTKIDVVSQALHNKILPFIFNNGKILAISAISSTIGSITAVLVQRHLDKKEK